MKESCLVLEDDPNRVLVMFLGQIANGVLALINIHEVKKPHEDWFKKAALLHQEGSH